MKLQPEFKSKYPIEKLFETLMLFLQNGNIELKFEVYWILTNIISENDRFY